MGEGLLGVVGSVHLGLISGGGSLGCSRALYTWARLAG